MRMQTHLRRAALAALAVAFIAATPAAAQQKVGYVDSQYILDRLPDYATAMQNLERMEQEWQSELEEKRRAVDEMFQEYQGRELLYTQEERQREQEKIIQAEEEIERLRNDYFGPEGQYFTEQERLLRPIQERVLEAVQEVATEESYDYVLDKSGDLLFMYAREQLDLSDDVLRELGIDIDNPQGG